MLSLTSMMDFGPTQPMVVPRPPLSLSTASLLRMEGSTLGMILYGRTCSGLGALILSHTLTQISATPLYRTKGTYSFSPFARSVRNRLKRRKKDCISASKICGVCELVALCMRQMRTELTFFFAGSVTPPTIRFSSFLIVFAATPVVADWKSYRANVGGEVSEGVRKGNR